MNQTDTVTKICATVLMLVILVGIFLLTWHGSISGGDALVAVGGIATAAVTAFGVHMGVQAGAKAAKAPSRLPE